jgi:hypothetical protein
MPKSSLIIKWGSFLYPLKEGEKPIKFLLRATQRREDEQMCRLTYLAPNAGRCSNLFAII